MVFPHNEGYGSLHPEEVLYIKSDNNYCKVISTLGITYTIRITMTDIEARIMKMPVSGTRFVRIHERYIISLSQVGFDKNFTEVNLRNGDILPISRSYRKQLNEHLEVF